MGGGGGGSWSSLGDIRSLEEKAKAALQKGRKNVFISFATEDLDEVNLLRGQAKNQNSDLEFNDHSVRVPYDSERATYIKAKITDRINRSSVCVIFVSDDTAQSKWVKWEVDQSLKLGKKVIAVYSQNNKPTKMPSWFSENNIKSVKWADLHEELSK